MLVLVGGYMFTLFASANLVLDQTQQMQMTYQHAEQIADEAVAVSH